MRGDRLCWAAFLVLFSLGFSAAVESHVSEHMRVCSCRKPRGSAFGGIAVGPSLALTRELNNCTGMRRVHDVVALHILYNISLHKQAPALRSACQHRGRSLVYHCASWVTWRCSCQVWVTMLMLLLQGGNMCPSVKNASLHAAAKQPVELLQGKGAEHYDYFAKRLALYYRNHSCQYVACVHYNNMQNARTPPAPNHTSVIGRGKMIVGHHTPRTQSCLRMI